MSTRAQVAKICGILSLLLALAGLSPSTASAEGGGGSFWNGSGTTTGAWVRDPASGVWTVAPVAVPDDPFIYTFEIACVVDSNDLNSDCRRRMFECSAAENGRLVQWLVSARRLVPPIFLPLGPQTCVYDTKPRDILEEIAARIEQDFRNSNVIPATIASQPGPNTLRGAETNFYADAKQQAFDIDLLGQKVHLTATPVEYVWAYGDGAALGPTPFAGGPLPESRWGERTATSHVYTTTGDYPVTVATNFRGTYAVNGGPPLPIPGQGTFSSAPVQVSVWRSETRNYADDCNRNPLGQGCPGVAAAP